MPVKLSQWGNSLGLRISKEIAERAALAVGDYLYLRLLDSGDILVRPVRARDIPTGYAVHSKPADSRTTPSALPESW